MSKVDKLKRLCGLTPNHLAEVLENNPRAYMAVKGAVAERHLFNYFDDLKKRNQIKNFRTTQSDFEKDFYVELLDGRSMIVECKNVEVLKITSKSDYLKYLKFLQKSRGLFNKENFTVVEDYKLTQLKEKFGTLPQRMRESGIPRYEFSENQIQTKSINGSLSEEHFLEQFNHAPLSIDFQRTRNSRDIANSGEGSKAERFYKLDEIDIVGACLFTRTMNWEFVFGSRQSLIIHRDFKNRYSNRLKFDPKKWHFNF